MSAATLVTVLCCSQIETHADGITAYQDIVAAVRIVEKGSLFTPNFWWKTTINNRAAKASRFLNFLLDLENLLAAEADNTITLANLGEVALQALLLNLQGRQTFVSVSV